jgi:hypothetical protein
MQIRQGIEQLSHIKRGLGLGESSLGLGPQELEQIPSHRQGHDHKHTVRILEPPKHAHNVGVP